MLLFAKASTWCSGSIELTEGSEAMGDDDKFQPYLMPRVGPSMFGALQDLMKEEEEFPRSYDDWRALWQDRQTEVEGDGYKAVFVDVIPEAFAKFCSSRKLPCSWTTLGQFITAKAGR